MMLQVAFAMEEAYSALTALAEARQNVADLEYKLREASVLADALGDHATVNQILADLDFARDEDKAARNCIERWTEPVRKLK